MPARYINPEREQFKAIFGTAGVADSRLIRCGELAPGRTFQPG